MGAAGATKFNGLSALPGFACCGRNQLLLGTVHFRSINGIFVAKSMQMEKSMCNVQTQFTLKRIAKLPRVISGCFDADDDLSVVKCNHVRRPGKVNKPAMQFRHALVRNQDHIQLGDTLQAAALLPRNLEALRHRAICETLQRRKRDAQSALPVPYGNFFHLAN